MSWRKLRKLGETEFHTVEYDTAETNSCAFCEAAQRRCAWPDGSAGVVFFEDAFGAVRRVEGERDGELLLFVCELVTKEEAEKEIAIHAVEPARGNEP